LKYLDNRIVLISVMELASIESADKIIEESNTRSCIYKIIDSMRSNASNLIRN